MAGFLPIVESRASAAPMHFRPFGLPECANLADYSCLRARSTPTPSKKQIRASVASAPRFAIGEKPSPSEKSAAGIVISQARG